jgi:hypothetical protein
LNPIDERARRLLLTAPKKDAEIVVASGERTDGIVKEYRDAEYANAIPAKEVLFHNWVAKCANSVALVS